MRDEIYLLDSDVRAAVEGLSADQTQDRPSGHPEKWSIQQIVEHLQKTYEASVPAIHARLEKGAPTRAVPSLHQYLGQFFVVRLGRFPTGRQAPAAVSPPVSSVPTDGTCLSGRVHAELERLEAAIAQAEGTFGEARAVSHMVLGPLSMQQWRRFHLVHGRHHVKQIWRIRGQHSF